MTDTAPHFIKPQHVLMLVILTLAMVNEARTKKPAGIYWLQTAALKIFSTADERQIWVHRLPSVLGALLAVLATYWGGAKLIGRDKAFISAALLATSLLFVFEAHIAKTDAVLCGLSACTLAALAHLRATECAKNRRPVWVFWLAFGGSIMIKGPIILAILAFTFIGYWAWGKVSGEKNLSWAKPLLNPFAIFVFTLMWLPWAIGIYIVTDGAFFQDSLGQDLGGKLVSAQEKHPGLPGYHLAFVWVMMWPASLLLLPAFTYAIKTIRSYDKTPQLTLTFKAMQLCLLWVVPFWVLIELMPTKLPHYSLPLYPAISLMIGASLTAIAGNQNFKKTRFISGGLFLLSSAIVIGALLYLSFAYGEVTQKTAAIIMGLLSGAACLYAIIAMSKLRIAGALGGITVAALIISTLGYKALLPNIEAFNISALIAAALGEDLPRLSGKTLASPSYTEPSLVYHLGTDIELGEDVNRLGVRELKSGHIILVDNLSDKHPDLLESLKRHETDDFCLKISDPISGFNYSKGDALEIYIIQEEPCSDRQ